LNQTIATQRDAALKQATTQVSAQLATLTTQMSSQLTTQQDAMTKNLQGVTDASIDRAYLRARSLVLITVGAILGAMLIYRLIVRRPAPAAPPKVSA
jgi:hypothetical protein